MMGFVEMAERSNRMAANRATWLPGALIAAIAGCAVEPATDTSSEKQPASGSSARASRHCVVAPSGETTCFGTFTEAIAVATAGEIADAPADPKLVDRPSFAARINAIGDRVKLAGPAASGIAPRSDVVIGIAYKDAHFEGDTWVFIQPFGCNGNKSTVDFSVDNLNTSPFTCCDFNDNISSFNSFNGCLTVLYEDWMFGGAATNGGIPIEGMGYVGDAMNDRASSIRWF